LALKTTAKDGEAEFGTETAAFVENSFYVDDGLKSVETVDQATKLIKNSVEMCQRGGFRLHKFAANKRDVIESIPVQYRATDVKELDLCHDPLPIERVLGIEWCIESDSFRFRITLKDKPLTRRGVLATISSIYDPLGFVAPVLLAGKRILQTLCKDNADWDDPLPETLKAEWERWRADIHSLENMKVERCFKPEDFGQVKTAELHHFSDASCEGYGQCSYLRLVDDNDKIHCSLVMGKSRVVPLKQVSIPRLELTAAVVSIKVSATLQDELEYKDIAEVYWTDSKVVLGYINNEARRFHIFVANRVQQIRDHSSKDQWNYVESKSNPADEASRGLKASEIMNDSRWINGPSFLYEAHQNWQHYNQPEDKTLLSPDDVEVKKVSAFTTCVQEFPNMLERLEYFSSWHRVKRAIAICLRYRGVLLQRVCKRKERNELENTENAVQDIKLYKTVTVTEMEVAELEIIKLVQKQEFDKELCSLKPVIEASTRESHRQTSNVSRTSPLARLDPFIDEHDIIRVGGRIRRSSMDANIKHPVVLPKKSHISMLIARHFHERVDHQGRGITWNEIRASGYWILGCKDVVAKLIKDCTVCRRLRASVTDQKMADLPKERVETSPPFAYSAVDYFGPFYIKQGRKEVKRYGVLFTCLASRAIHLEVSHTLETDSFLNAFRRFVCRRGPVRVLRCDRGTNFVGASTELQKCLKEMDQAKVEAELLKENCDWVEFKFNVPKASHMGGIWERQIRTVRNVLNILLYQNGSQLNDESLLTFICEAESIVNSRPLSVDNLGLSDSLEALTPNHLLTRKSKVLLPPPGVFQKEDVYLRKHWRRVQHLCNEFWVRWKKEFVHSLQERQKWLKPRHNLGVGDVVIIAEEETPRNCWPLARVINAEKDEDGLVRMVKLKVGDRQATEQGRRKNPLATLERPVHKLILLMQAEERPGIPAEEPSKD
jgi:hypothetical protein